MRRLMPFAQRWVGPLALLAAVTAAHGFQSVGVAQPRDPDAFVNRQRAIDEEMRRLQEREPGAGGDIAFGYGGWYSFHLLLFDDGIESSRTFRRHDLRLWARAVIDGGAHEFYARGRFSLLDFNSGDSFDGDDDDLEGPNLERGYYRFDLGKASQAYGWAALDYDVTVEVGRDLVELGTGLTLSEPLDHVALALTASDLRWTGLVGRTVGSSQDFDLTRNTDRTRRVFWGAELTYLGFERHEPFVYVLWQRDHNRDALPHPLQDFDYDSFYVGLGSTGELTKGLRYLTEWVHESGHSFGRRRFLDSDVIRAWALNVQLEYLFRGPRKGRVSLEYLFATGDSNRLDSPTDAIGGNRFDLEDKGFIGFGYRDTGLSLAPRYANLHMWRAGGSFHPWPDRPRLSRLELGANWFLYHKNHRRGAISDVTADLTSGYLGWEMDYYASWELSPDLTWTARFGTFFPGDAFSDRTSRTFLITGMTWSF